MRLARRITGARGPKASGEGVRMERQPRPINVDTPLRGKAYVFGDDVPVDRGILPAGPAGSADPGRVVMTALDPSFPNRFERGGFIVAGRNFPTGVAHERAIRALLDAGVAAVIAETMAGGFFRAALNDGLPAMQIAGITSLVREGDSLEVSLRHATVRNVTTGQERKGFRMGAAVAQQLEAGGTRAFVARKWGAIEPRVAPSSAASAGAVPDPRASTQRLERAAPSLADRIRGAIWGQLIGDAACLGTHWIYNQAEIATLWPDGLRGMEESSPKFKTSARTEQGTRDHMKEAGHYHQGKRSGEQTHYGHGALLQLASVAERGRFDAADFGRRFVEAFGSPTYTGYKDHAMRMTMFNYAALRDQHPGAPIDYQRGADDFEQSTTSRIASVVVAHRDDPAFLDVIERATRVTQNNTRAVAHAQFLALALRALLRGAPIRDALAEAADSLPRGTDRLEEVPQELRDARLRESAEMVPANASFGQACRIDGSFPAGGAFAPIWPATLITQPQPFGPMCLHTTCSAEEELRLPSSAHVYAEVRAEYRGALARADEEVPAATAALGPGCRLNNSFTSATQAALHHERDFRAAVLNTSRAGGDNAGRASTVGALLGASLGIGAIPREWREGLAAREEVARHVERLVEASAAATPA
ncbi:MAG: hypothetical protein FJ034_08245, partial [Chloroflexi bacterium]|nr:hypothetical protein [Chloroflexota bacterium]